MLLVLPSLGGVVPCLLALTVVAVGVPVAARVLNLLILM